jgi:hypothetical protein
MLTFELSELKTSPDYLDYLLQGETILLSNKHQLIAELKPIEAKKKTQRPPPGLFEGQIKLTEAFFEPLPDDMLKAMGID